MHLVTPPYNRCAIKLKIALRRNVEFPCNADTTDQVCTFRGWCFRKMRHGRETSWEQSLLWLQV